MQSSLRFHRLATLLLGLVLSPVLPIVAQQDDSGPSLKETGTWLVGNLPHLSSTYVVIRTPEANADPKHNKKLQPVPLITNQSIAVTGATMDGCHLTVTQQYTTTEGGTTTTQTSSLDIPLDHMQAIFLGVNERPARKMDGYTESFMPATDNILHVGAPYAVISRSDSTTTGVADKTTSTSDSAMTHQLKIESDDLILSQRIAKALNHAVRLCQATVKPEPF